MLPASLTELDLLVLAFLHEEPCHGYRLVCRMREHCSHSAVYRCLRRLHAKGLISDQVVEQKKIPDRYDFSLTPAGSKALFYEEYWNTDLQSHLARVGKKYEKLNLLLRFRPQI